MNLEITQCKIIQSNEDLCLMNPASLKELNIRSISTAKYELLIPNIESVLLTPFQKLNVDAAVQGSILKVLSLY